MDNKDNKKPEFKRRDRERDDRIFLGYKDQEGIEQCMKIAANQGYVVYLDEKTNEIFIRRDTSMVYRAKDAVFKRVKDGTYNFVGDNCIYVGRA